MTAETGSAAAIVLVLNVLYRRSPDVLRNILILSHVSGLNVLSFLLGLIGFPLSCQNRFQGFSRTPKYQHQHFVDYKQDVSVHVAHILWSRAKLQDVLCNLARVRVKVRMRLRFKVRVRFWAGICKLRLRDLEIAQRNLRVAQLHKSCTTCIP